jgi:uridylate kinase
METISYRDVLRRGLTVIDPAAISLCSENNVPIVVLNMFTPGNIEKAIRGEKVGTRIAR